MVGKVQASHENESVEAKPITFESSLRRSNRVIRPPQWFSPSLHYLLLIDVGS